MHSQLTSHQSRQADPTGVNQKFLEINVNGTCVGLHESGCIWLPDDAVLAVADLHFETASHNAERGYMWPPYDTVATLEKLAKLIDLFNPRALIALGDSFHDGGGAARLPGAYRALIATMQLSRDWIWIRGNHDPLGPDNLGGESLEEIRIGQLDFRHIPKNRYVAGEIAGHLHPAARIRRKGRALRRPCFVGDRRRLILPAFGALTGGLNVLDLAFEPLFGENQYTAYLLGDSAVHRFPAGKLRPDERSPNG